MRFSSLLSALFLSLAAVVAPTYATAITFTTSSAKFNAGVLNQGWWSSGPSHNNGTGNDNHYTGLAGSDILRSFYTFDLTSLTSLTETATSATFRVKRGGQSSTASVEMWDVSTDAALLNANNGINAMIFSDIGSGNSYGTSTVSTGNSSDYLSFTLNSQALSDITAASGFFSIGVSLSNVGGNIFSGTGGDVTYLDVTTVAVPEPATLALFGLGLLGLAVLRKRKQSSK